MKTPPFQSNPDDAGLMAEKLTQQDISNEVWRIARTQGLDDDLVIRIIDQLFQQHSPRGSSLSRVGKDPLPGQNGRRDTVNSPTYQNFKVANTLTNLRIDENGTPQKLTPVEIHQVFRLSERAAEDPENVEYTWTTIAELLGVESSQIKGATDDLTDEDPARPPINSTLATFGACKDHTIREWFLAAAPKQREALVEIISDAGYEPSTSPDHHAVEEFIASLTSESLHYLENKIRLRPGRAAYSRDSHLRLTECMLTHGVDLHEARKIVFGVDDSWQPPAEPLDTLTGNPAVDRTNKIVARALLTAQRRWGPAQAIIIEHVRDAFVSEAQAKSIDRRVKGRRRANADARDEVAKKLGIDGDITRNMVRRHQIVEMQNFQCLYCGDSIDAGSCEIDHILPRSGPSSSNRRENLAASCRPCNHAKSNKVFSVWAAASTAPSVSLDGALERVKGFAQPPSMNHVEFTRFKKAVSMRLQRTEADDDLDVRSMESVAYMARSLTRRLKQHFPGTNVQVYKGSLTALARKGSGFEQRIPYVGSFGRKSRLDRRHHAVDAAVIALINPSVARTLAITDELRRDPSKGSEDAHEPFAGDSPAAQQKFKQWIENMTSVANWLADSMREDRIPVVHPTRLRLANSQVHAQKASKFARRKLGAAFTAQEIDRAATPPLWCALTRLPDYDPDKGLPADPNRVIKVHSTKIHADGEICFVPGNLAFLAVRKGYMAVGNSIHHARVYKWSQGKKTRFGIVRVFNQDLRRNAKDDLFAVKLPPQSMSVRDAPKGLRQALANGSAEYLGWLVAGDEVVLGNPEVPAGEVQELLKAFPEVRSWVISGFPVASKIRLRPTLLAEEGFPDDTPQSLKKIIGTTGWRVSANVLLGECEPTIIRRTVLGRPRRDASDGLPTCWQPR